MHTHLRTSGDNSLYSDNCVVFVLQLQKELERAEAEEKRLREEREKLIKEQDEKMRQLELREKVCIISA